MATINFIHPAFQVKVVDDKVSLDGYDASNLVNVQDHMPPKGYMSERFVKPPVCLYFTFPCNIDIARVIVHGVIGSQRTTGYELYSFSSLRKADTWCQRWEPGDGSLAPNVAYFNNYKFSPLGKVFQDQQAELADVVCFSNPNYKPRRPFSELTTMPSKLYNQRNVLAEMRQPNNKNLNSVSHLLLRIVRTAASAVPAIRWVEVWGQPARDCTKEDVDQVLKAYHNREATTGNASQQKPSILCRPSSQPNRDVNNTPPNQLNVSDDVPDDFKDALTHEIMRQPILLPSGYSIDLSSLEKNNEEQAKYGRSPADPFTSQLFTATRRPLPNAKLKARIDHYVMMNGINLVSNPLGRSVDLSTGNSRNEQRGQASILVTDQPTTVHANDRQTAIVNPQTNVPYLPPQPIINQTRGLIHGHAASAKPALVDRPLFLNSAIQPGASVSSNGGNTPYDYSVVPPTAPGTKRHLPDHEAAGPSREVKSARMSGVPVIDLTHDSESDAAIATNTGREPPHVGFSVIRRNPAVLHEKSLAQSLDVAIDDALSNLPSFHNCQQPATASKLLPTTPTSKLECVFCTLYREVSMMYKLGCSDVACRDCLSTRRRTGKIMCFKCDQTTPTRQITKLHV